jgi:Holliday junction resolvase RusA-like endonuclease
MAAIRLSRAAVERIFSKREEAPEPEARPGAKKAKANPGKRLKEGTVLARFKIEGVPVPWRAPNVFRKVARTPAHVKAYKEGVARSAHAAGYGEANGIKPYGYPVKLVTYFCRKAPSKKLIGTWWGKRPDVDNLQKALSDCITGNVLKQVPKRKKGDPRVSNSSIPPSPIGRILTDDNVVTSLDVQKIYWHESCAWIEVVALGPACDKLPPLPEEEP